MGDWTGKKLGLAIIYKDPLDVGRGRDNVMTSLRNPSMFISTTTGNAITAENSITVKQSTT